MKRVHSSESLVEISHLRNVLEQAGIACVIKNQALAGALGELPFLDCAPELWVLNDKNLERARALLAAEREPLPNEPPWRCARCGEENETQFAACWRCASADTNG